MQLHAMFGRYSECFIYLSVPTIGDMEAPKLLFDFRLRALCRRRVGLILHPRSTNGREVTKKSALWELRARCEGTIALAKKKMSNTNIYKRIMHERVDRRWKKIIKRKSQAKSWIHEMFFSWKMTNAYQKSCQLIFCQTTNWLID